MSDRSVFFDEWLRSLREHYKHVIATDDRVTEPSLRQVMHSVGFGEEELSALYREATQHIDNLPDGFMPDMERAGQALASAPDTSFTVHPAECTCPACMDTVLEIGHDDEGQPLPEPDPDEADAETGHTFSMPGLDSGDDGGNDPDGPQQMSMF